MPGLMNMPDRGTDDHSMTRDSHIVPRRALALACVTLMTFAPPASAYLDPGTGSMILSAIVGLFATAALAIKTYWYKIKRLLTGKDQTPNNASAKPRNRIPPAKTRDRRELTPHDRGPAIPR